RRHSGARRCLNRDVAGMSVRSAEEVAMIQSHKFLIGLVLSCCLGLTIYIVNGSAQDSATQSNRTQDSRAGAQDETGEQANARTMRPVIRGRQFAASSMKLEATRAAERILEAGGNAFDAIVAGQAALAVSDAALNGVGSDAVILVYDARAKKVLS